MASSKPTLAVILSPNARRELKGIYAHNAKKRSPSQAIRYEDFLLDGIATLATEYDDGKDIDGFPELKKLTFKPSTRGDRHIVIYEIDEAAKVVNIHHLYHTKWMCREG